MGGQEEVDLEKEQSRFITERGLMDGIFCLLQMIEKYREEQVTTYCIHRP